MAAVEWAPPLRVATELGEAGPWLRLAAWSVAALAVSPRDDAWVDGIADAQPLGSDGVDRGYKLGHRWTTAGLALGVTAAGWVSGRDQLCGTGILLVEAQILSASATAGLKPLFGRDRPDHSNRLSLPSGHATGAMTTALLLQARYGPWVGVPALAAASFVGLSRVQGRKHHPSDVLAGFGVAHWAVRAVLGAAEPDDAPGLSWFPAPAPGSTGLPLLRLRW